MVLWLISVLHELKMLWKLRLWRRSARLISTLESRQDLRITKLNWSTGIVIAAKKG